MNSESTNEHDAETFQSTHNNILSSMNGLKFKQTNNISIVMLHELHLQRLHYCSKHLGPISRHYSITFLNRLEEREGAVRIASNSAKYELNISQIQVQCNTIIPT